MTLVICDFVCKPIFFYSLQTGLYVFLFSYFETDCKPVLFFQCWYGSLSWHITVASVTSSLLGASNDVTDVRYCRHDRHRDQRCKNQFARIRFRLSPGNGQQLVGVRKGSVINAMKLSLVVLLKRTHVLLNRTHSPKHAKKA